MKKKILFSVLFISTISFAHEFWLAPASYIGKAGQVFNIRFKVGENFTGINWKGNNKKVQQLAQYEPDGTINDLSSLIQKNGDSLQTTLYKTGTHLFIFQSTNSFIELDAKKFNEYLKEDGIENTIDYRKKNKEWNLPAKEYYQRSVKTLVNVLGDSNQEASKNPAITNPTTLPLDIIPTINPYQLNSKTVNPTIQFTILFKGQPVSNALVNHWQKTTNGKTIRIVKHSNAKGQVAFLQAAGETMISCVHMVKHTADTTANWQSYWGSLTYYFPKGNNKKQ